MKKTKLLVGKILYRTIGCLLPASASRFGGKIGKKFRGFCGRLLLEKAGVNINIEKKAIFSNKVSLGDHSGIGKNAFIQGKTIIGTHVMMGPNVNIFSINHRTDRTDIPMCEQGSQNERPVIIGNDVWIAAGVTILPGTHIGNGVILGAASVVRGNIPDYAVAIGNPAQIIRYRRNHNAEK